MKSIGGQIKFPSDKIIMEDSDKARRKMFLLNLLKMTYFTRLITPVVRSSHPFSLLLLDFL